MTDGFRNNEQFLVVGPPRGGFTLLLSVLAILFRDRDIQKSEQQKIADPYISIAGQWLDSVIRDWFCEQVGEDRLFYNREFSIIVGGPKWISTEDEDTVCVRKYLGIKGEGDFTFLLYLPRWVLAFDEIIHSHSHPTRWVQMPDYSNFKKFSSIRNPIDIIHSSVFSINALASEYIQREMQLDEHQIRRELALNKLTNPEFISGLIVFLKKYLDEFITVSNQYDYVMRWEDLIEYPAEEIQHIAEATGRPITEDYATQIWAELDHRNLTRYHRHSFRLGLLHDWQFNLTNTHLKLFEKAGFADYLKRFNYDPIAYFDEKDYTPDQRLIEEHICRQQPYVENLDNDIITFAFNKTNFSPSPRFKFKHYSRQGAVEIEKSTLRDETLEKGFMALMATASQVVFDYLKELQLASASATANNDKPLADLWDRYGGYFRNNSKSSQEQYNLPPIIPQPLKATPRLAGSIAEYNIVHFDGCYYSVPQALGPIDLGVIDRSSLPSKILVAATYEEASQAIKRGPKN